MVTVDDLVISLTIKETGKLGKLQKQLNAIVGKTGKLGIARFSASLMYIKRDLNAIRSRLKWLRPTELPTEKDPKGIRMVAGTILQDLKDKGEKIVRKLLKTPNTETYYKEFDVTIGNEEELIQKMLLYLDNIKQTVGEIFEGKSFLTPKKQEIVTHTLHNLIAQAASSREIGKKFWREISKFEPETLWQKTIEELYRAWGGKILPQKPLYMVKPKAMELEGIQKAMGLGIPEDIVNLLKELERGTSDLDFNIREIQDFINIEKFETIFGIKAQEKGVLAEYMGKIMESKDKKKISEMIEKIKTGFFTKLNTQDVKNIGLQLVSKETKENLDKIVKKIYKWTLLSTMGAKAIDIEIIEGYDKIRKKLDAQLYTREKVGSELKLDITREDIDKLAVYEKYYGENLIIVARQIKEGVASYAKYMGLEKNIVLMPDIREKQIAVGLAQPLVDIESEGFKKEFVKLGKGLSQESFLSSVGEIIKQFGGEFNLEDLQKFITKKLDDATAEREKILAQGNESKTKENNEPTKQNIPGGH